MSEQIIQIAQVDNPIIDNLINTENKLNELNSEVNTIVSDYNSIKPAETSFFNFDNPFFLLTLVGLLMLVFALWFLKKELRYEQSKKKFNAIKKEEAEIEERLEESAKKNKLKETKTTTAKKTTQSKGRKIKVIKIK